MVQNHYRTTQFRAMLPNPRRYSMELIHRRCYELKHELNGVSYAADVRAPRKV